VRLGRYLLIIYGKGATWFILIMVTNPLDLFFFKQKTADEI